METKSLSQLKVLLTGAQGMLAAQLAPLLQSKKANLLLADQFEGERFGQNVLSVDITDAKIVRDLISEIRPHWIVNCAAYTAVDDAEAKQELAFAVNATGPANLAKAAKTAGSKLLHVSTDYVFGGSAQSPRNTPFTEEDPFAPCGIYGQSKRFGDELVSTTLPEQHLIVRTSWLHGVHGHNFVGTIVRLAKEKPEISVVKDQIGSPTWAGWLADRMVQLMEMDARGTFHVASRGNISWFDFAEEIIRQLGLSVKVLPQTTAELNRPAPRPAYSTLDVSKLEKFIGQPCISWKEGIAAHLKALNLVKS